MTETEKDFLSEDKDECLVDVESMNENNGGKKVIKGEVTLRRENFQRCEGSYQTVFAEMFGRKS